MRVIFIVHFLGRGGMEQHAASTGRDSPPLPAAAPLQEAQSASCACAPMHSCTHASMHPRALAPASPNSVAFLISTCRWVGSPGARASCSAAARVKARGARLPRLLLRASPRPPPAALPTPGLPLLVPGPPLPRSPASVPPRPAVSGSKSVALYTVPKPPLASFLPMTKSSCPVQNQRDHEMGEGSQACGNGARAAGRGTATGQLAAQPRHARAPAGPWPASRPPLRSPHHTAAGPFVQSTPEPSPPPQHTLTHTTPAALTLVYTRCDRRCSGARM